MRIFKGQISIEFMIVFSFILVVFLFLFALITQQRALTQNSQTFSQLQLVAQTIALQINRASQAGTGFTALLPLTTNIGNIPYNISVTKGGLVIVSATVGTQIMRTTAYSNVQSVTSDPSFYGTTNSIYVLPISNGSIYLQNSFGAICVDYQCPTNTNQSSKVSLSTQVVQAAQFNGAVGGSQLTGVNANSLKSNTGTGFSVSAWVYTTNISTSRGITQGNSYVFRIDSPGEGNKLSWFMYIANSIEPRLSSTNSLKLNQWYHVVGTYNASTGYMGLYINGALNNSETRAGAATLGYCACFNIGVGSSSDWAGMISNFQLYNEGLSANQVKALYNNGIAGAPINSTYLKGWWPLNGNANDYSGYGQNLASGTVLFPGVAQIFANVQNPLGQSVNNVLVGFSTSLGNFSSGLGANSQASASYTNSNGVASVFLNQLGTVGQALVKATAFSSNALPQLSLAGWYPLSFGQGSLAHDISGNKNSGTIGGQFAWALPNYVATFNGQNGYIFVNGSSTLTGLNAVTVSFWLNLKNNNGNQFFMRVGSASTDSYQVKLQGNAYNNAIRFRTDNAVSGGVVDGKFAVPTNQWLLVSQTFDGSNVILYLNGNPVNSMTWAGPLASTHGNSIFIGGIGGFTPTQSSGVFTNGSISNMQIYNKNLSLPQIRQLYSQGIASAPVANTILAWYPLDGNANDYSGNFLNGSIYGGVSFTPLLQTLSSSQVSDGNLAKILTASFNGVSSFVKVGNVPKINSQSNWSLSFWMNSTSVSSFKNPIDANFVPGQNNAGPRFEQGSANTLNLIVGTSLATYTSYMYTNTLAPNSWYHVIASRNGNTILGYLNGQMVLNATNTNWPSGFTNLTIGRGFGNSANRWFSGNISNVQVYNQTINSQQALSLYQEGVGGAPIPSLSLAAWLPLTGNANNYSASSGINSTTVTNVIYKNKIDYTPFVVQSNNYSGIYFNGQNTYIQTNTLLAYDKNAPFSIGFWMNTNSGGQDAFLVGDENGLGALSAGFQTWLWHGSKCANWRFEDTSGNTYAPSSCSANVEDGNWHYIVATYDGSSNQAGMKVYVDGKIDGIGASTVISASINPTGIEYNALLTIGAGNAAHNYPYNGLLSNVQIFSTQLTSAQVQQLYSLGLPPKASATIPLGWSP